MDRRSRWEVIVTPRVYSTDWVPDRARKKVIKEYLDDVKQKLLVEKRVKMDGIGIIRIKDKKARKAHMGRNPATGEPIKIPAKPKSKRVAFRPTKDLKELVQGR